MHVYKALDVAQYVIRYCIDRGIPLSNLKLQKLLYFIQAFYLVRFDRPCFKDPIQAWDFGPVVPSVYHAFKQYGAGNIPYVVPDAYNVKNEIVTKDQQRISLVLDTFAKYTANALVRATHRQSPWKDVYNPTRHGIVITTDSIKEYFNAKYGRK